MTLAGLNSLRRSTAPSPEVAEGGESDAYLFETPPDLLCPITHELFHEPVINAAGQVYERAAIEKAMAHRLVDPISNLSLTTAALTTVWPMKSKAAAYRERALRGCVERLCRPTCRSPIRFLRRAAELSAGLAPSVDASTGAVLGLPGLTSDVVEYLLTHPSSIYDLQALSRYAASLAAGGYRDLAAGVYSQLLHLGGDSGQQVEALQGLLACWGTPGREEEGEDEADEQRLVERLAALSCGEGPDGCRPARFVGVLLEAGLREELVLRFCEYILGGNGVVAIQGSAGGCGGGGGSLDRISCSSLEKGGGGGAGLVDRVGGAGVVGSCAGPTAASAGAGAGYADLLFVYTKLRCGRLEAAQARQQADVGASAGSCAESEHGPACATAAAGSGRFSNEGGAGKWREGGPTSRRRRRVQRAVCSAVFALSSLVGSGQPLARVLQAASALLLLNPPLRGGDG